MKANELMIGDWVFIDEPNKYAGCKGTVQTLCNHRSNDGFYLTVYIQGDKAYCNTEVFNEDLRPIPLTKEILEKNGFEEFGGWYIYIPENTGIEIAWLGTILKIGGECGNLELPAIEYVHQLQHALRLCGIEKEIKL